MRFSWEAMTVFVMSWPVLCASCHGVSNDQPHDCLLNRLFRRISKKTLKLCPTGLCAGTSPVTGEFPAQMASNAENVYIQWRHHESNDSFRHIMAWVMSLLHALSRYTWYVLNALFIEILLFFLVNPHDRFIHILPSLRQSISDVNLHNKAMYIW